MRAPATGADGKPTRVRWRVVAVLAAASFISYGLRSNVSIAMPAMMADLALSEVQMGWLASAFLAGYAIFQYPGGLFGTAVGPRRAFAIITVLWGLLTLASAAVPAGAAALASLIAIRFLTGAVHAPIYPLATDVIERWFPVGGWALPQGLTSTALTLGTAAFAPIYVWSIAEFGWRPAFAVVAPLGLVAAWLCWTIMRDDPATHPAINAAEVKLISTNLPPARSAGNGQPAWLRVLKDRNVLLLTTSYFCANAVFYFFFTWVFYYFAVVRSYDEEFAGYLTSLQWIAGAVGATIGGIICDWLTRRYGLRRACRWMSMGSLTLSAAAMAVAATPAGPVVLGACLALGFLAMQMAEAPHWAAAIGVGGSHAGPASGVMNTGGNGSGFVFAILMPAVAAWLGWSAALAMTAIVALVGALLWIFIRADDRMPD